MANTNITKFISLFWSQSDDSGLGADKIS